jgi:hypothetical protein
MPEFLEDDIVPRNFQEAYHDEFLRLNAQAHAQHTGELEHPNGGIAFQTVQRSEQDNPQTMTRYSQDLLDDDHPPTASVDNAEQDERLQSFVNSVVYSDASAAVDTIQMDGGTAFDTHAGCLGTAAPDVPCQLGPLPHEMTDSQTEAAEVSALMPSVIARLEAVETLLSLSRGGYQAKMPANLDPNLDDTVFQHRLPGTEQREIELSAESETRSAMLLKDLRAARPYNSGLRAESPFIRPADIHFPHPPSDRSESPLNMDPNSQPTFVSTIEHPVSAPDMSLFLQSRTAAASQHVQDVERIRQRKQGWFLHVGKVVAYICRLPTEEREKETIRFLACLGLSQPQQEAAFKVFARMAERNKETTKWAPHMVFRKWLSLCVLDVQRRAKAARNDAIDVETAGKGTFCSGGIHKLKCGHECRSNQDCGINCITFAAYPDTSLIDLRMSEIRCNERTA